MVNANKIQREYQKICIEYERTFNEYNYYCNEARRYSDWYMEGDNNCGKLAKKADSLSQKSYRKLIKLKEKREGLYNICRKAGVV